MKSNRIIWICRQLAPKLWTIYILLFLIIILLYLNTTIFKYNHFFNLIFRRNFNDIRTSVQVIDKIDIFIFHGLSTIFFDFNPIQIKF